ncbi:MAG: tRNA pseudouridine(54/55) synthase Pus10 [Candidatus Bilamarchaeaceae archaeon]
MKLCNVCNSSKKNAFEEGDCFICQNHIGSLENIAQKGAALLPSNIKFFSLSTTIPNEWLAREEIVWDYKLTGTVSIKTFINQFLNERISALSGKKPKSDGDVILLVKFPAGDVSICWNDLFVFGKYKKLKAGLSQTRWVCSNCNGKGCEKCKNLGKFYHSVEEEIGEALKKACKADSYIMYASGREDIDVTNLAGRPFVLQLKGAQVRTPNLLHVSNEINNKKNVMVEGLKIVRRGSVETVTTSHFDKCYRAVVEFESKPTEEQINEILKLAGRTIKQKTPIRVEHRRAFLTRERKVLDISLISLKDKRAEFLITTEPGTYIKELVSGDEGRTTPSFSSAAGVSARCVSLCVVKILDDFLDWVKL